MGYTTVAAVAAMFPSFQRGGVQSPADASIQTYIDDVASDLNAILTGRFNEAIQQSHAGSFAAYTAALGPDALNVLERANRYGAAAQLGWALATRGAQGVQELVKMLESRYEAIRRGLRAVGASGQPLNSGDYDHLFDASARTVTPRPGLQGIAGGEMPRGESPRDEGLSDYFGKFDRRES